MTGLVYVTGCQCAGSGCGGHAELPQPAAVVAQHTYTAGCGGLHPPGPCPAYEKPLEFRSSPGYPGPDPAPGG